MLQAAFRFMFLCPPVANDKEVKRIKTEAYGERKKCDDCLNVCSYMPIMVSASEYK